jgi:tRNA (cytidine56-2'-O)-methyltransferase
MPIIILRLGHRPARDKRITTHCALVARAFGAAKIIYSGLRDPELERSVEDVAERWGGKFTIQYQKNWKKAIKDFKGKKILLTMYGIPIKERMDELRKLRNLLLIVGGEKVPADVYGLVDMQIAITNQPHSEVAAIAVFLHEFFSGKKRKFTKARIKVIPQERGKLIIEK